MELLPIIETAVLVFSVFTVVTLVISYSLYKIKQKERLTNAEPAAVKVVPQAKAAMQYNAAPVVEKKEPSASYHEQVFQFQQRQIQQQEVARVQQIMARDRFLVVNNQQPEMRAVAAVNKSTQPFYHPRASETRKQIMGRKSFNLFDNYSNGGEKLEKLNLSMNA